MADVCLGKPFQLERKLACDIQNKAKAPAMISKLDRGCNWDNKNRPAIATRISILRFFADCAAKKWPLRGSKSNDLRHKNIFGALKASSQGEHEELQLPRRMFICKTCQIR